MKMKNCSKILALGFTTASLISVLAACDPVPRRTLSTDEKIADLYWIYSQYGENYAPLDYKQQTLKINFDQLKLDYVEAAKKTTTNDEFYDLMFKFVAEFHDAHNSASLTNSSLPDRAQVAFLGFSGIRNGDTLLVKKLLPTITKDSAYPIKEGDLITKIDGKLLKDVIKEELLPLRNLGNDEANITFHMNKLFTRVSTASVLPKNKDAVITLKRGETEFTYTLPWVMKDLYQFQADQAKATAKKDQATASPTPSTQTDEPKTSDSNFMMLSDDFGSQTFKFNFIGFNGRINKPMATLTKVMDHLRKTFADGFRLVDDVAEWSPVATTADTEKTPLEALKDQRSVMDKAVYLSDSKTYPAYIAPKAVVGADGKETGETKLIGYIYIDSFDPDSGEETTLKEFKATLLAMQSMGVNDLVLDTINNGGGSLTLGMKMAQLLSNKKVEMPKMEMRLSDSWLDQFQTETLHPASDAEGEIARRVLAEMLSRKTETLGDGKPAHRLSQAYSAEILAPFTFEPNTDLKKPFKIAVITNEMCASMCDIFAGILQDNNMATIIGTRTMGAGGNVVDYNQAPNSHLTLRQTESLIVRKDGSYLENHGVTPTIEIKVNESAKDKYAPVLNKALDFLVTIPAAKADPKPASHGGPAQPAGE